MNKAGTHHGEEHRRDTGRVRHELVALHERVKDGRDVGQVLGEGVEVRSRPRVRLMGGAKRGQERVVLGTVRLAVMVLADEGGGRLGNVVPENTNLYSRNVVGQRDHNGRTAAELSLTEQVLEARTDRRVRRQRVQQDDDLEGGVSVSSEDLLTRDAGARLTFSSSMLRSSKPGVLPSVPALIIVMASVGGGGLPARSAERSPPDLAVTLAVHAKFRPVSRTTRKRLVTDLLKHELEFTLARIDEGLGGFDRLGVGKRHRRDVKSLGAQADGISTLGDVSIRIAGSEKRYRRLTLEATALAPPIMPRFEDGDGGADWRSS